MCHLWWARSPFEECARDEGWPGPLPCDNLAREFRIAAPSANREGKYLARFSWLKAGLSHSTPGISSARIPHLGQDWEGFPPNNHHTSSPSPPHPSSHLSVISVQHSWISESSSTASMLKINIYPDVMCLSWLKNRTAVQHCGLLHKAFTSLTQWLINGVLWMWLPFV